MKWLNVRKSLFERQYRRKLKSIYFMSQAAEYEGTLARIQHWLQYADETLDARARLELLNFLMEAILEDIRSSAACELVYAPRYKTRDWRGVLDFGYRLGAKCGGVEQISSEGKTVVSSPYDWEKTFLALRSILTRGFHSDLGDYNGIYYPELNLISVTNGMHHSWVASQKRQHGVYRVSVYRLADMFPRFFTDGEFWYDRSKPNARYPVYDVRIALLYELARMKNASREDKSR